MAALPFYSTVVTALTRRESKQSLSVLNLETDELADWPDDRLGSKARQTYFLAWLLALTANTSLLPSLLSPILSASREQHRQRYRGLYLENGRITPERFLPLTPRDKIPDGKIRRHGILGRYVPCDLSVGMSGGEERLLVACNNSDEALLLNTSDGKIVHRFDLSTFKHIPASLPYMAVITSDGQRGFVSLWNASTVAELDLGEGTGPRFIPLRKPASALAGGLSCDRSSPQP